VRASLWGRQNWIRHSIEVPVASPHRGCARLSPSRSPDRTPRQGPHHPAGRAREGSAPPPAAGPPSHRASAGAPRSRSGVPCRGEQGALPRPVGLVHGHAPDAPSDGTASSCGESGPTLIVGQGDPLWIRRPPSSLPAWAGRTPDGGASGSRASSASSVSVWGRAPSGGSFAAAV